MAHALDLMVNAMSTAWNRLIGWITNLGLDPLAVLAVAAALIVIALIVLARPRPDRPAASNGTRGRPDLLVSRGEITQAEASTYAQLTLTVGNLNPYPAQLLELALRTNAMPEPEIIEADVLLPPHQSVTITADLEEVTGERGTLDLYLYATRTSHRYYRLRTRLEWEPWHSRYKIVPLHQRLGNVRELASTRTNRRARKEWRRQNRPAEEPTPEAPPQQAPLDDAPTENQDERRGRMDFPKEF